MAAIEEDSRHQEAWDALHALLVPPVRNFFDSKGRVVIPTGMSPTSAKAPP